ncbi:hypothetical protein ABTZ57_01385 [Streptomyces sp. NPDC094048]|uniref:hypothetical protein n=1 Tax=unclassified Streptomyces TaxID=2593676 RepID=UPI00331D91BF
MEWISLLPLAGVVVGSGLTLVGQGLTDRRAVRRDELAAKRSADAQDRADWLILQRQTITELQEILELVASTMVPLNSGTRLRESIAEDAAQATRRMHSRIARLEDRQLAADITAWIDGSHESARAMTAGMQALQARLGEQLRATHKP